MGIIKAKMPKVPKVLVWPADIVHTAADAFAFVVTAQNAAQPSPYPSIYRFKGSPMTMFEVLKPSFCCPIDVFNDDRHASAIASLRLGADGVFKLFQTFLAWPAGSILKMVAKKIESFAGLAGIYQAGLPRVQGQFQFPDQFTDKCQRRFGFLPAFAENYKVSRPRELPPQPLSEPSVNLSAHWAPIIQPPVLCPSSSGETAGVAFGQFHPANVPPFVDGLSTF